VINTTVLACRLRNSSQQSFEIAHVSDLVLGSSAGMALLTKAAGVPPSVTINGEAEN
jgi:hypothetical protein